MGSLVLLLSSASLAKTPGVDSARPNQGKEPDRLEFGIYVLDIDAISGQDQSFVANFYLGLKWKDERLAHSGKFAHVLPLDQVWHPTVLLANRQARLRMPLPQVVEVEPDGTGWNPHGRLLDHFANALSQTVEVPLRQIGQNSQELIASPSSDQIKRSYGPGKRLDDRPKNMVSYLMAILIVYPDFPYSSGVPETDLIV